MKNLLKNIKLLLLSYRLRFSENINYRASLISHSIAMLTYAFLRVAIILIAGSLGQGITGWNTYQLILFTGIQQVYISLIFLLVYRQLYILIQNIFLGQLEYDLTKPVDSQLAIALKGSNLNNIFGVVLGIIIIIFSLFKLKLTPSITNFIISAIFLLFGVLIIYSIMFVCSILNFWFDRLENAREFGLRLAGEVSRFPANAYHKAGTIMYFLLLPFTLSVTIPAQALLNQFNLTWMLGLIVISLSLFYLSRKFWQFALKNYSSASS